MSLIFFFTIFTLSTINDIFGMMKFFVSCILLFPVGLLAQDKPHTDQSLYVVIGAFGVPRNAIEFTENAKKQGYAAQFELNPKRKLFYVYVLHTEDRKAAIKETVRFQKESPYHDTWMYAGLLGDNPQVVKIGADEHREALEVLAEEKETNAIQTDTTQKAEVVSEIKDETKPKEVPAASSSDLKSFIFLITAAVDKDTLVGDIDIYDADAANKNRKAGTYRGNDAVNVKPVNKSGNLLLECEVFGYRKAQLPLNFLTPEATDGVRVENDQVLVPFELVRLQKGDKAIMFNVYFYKDAAVMRPESRYEISSLLEMMQENPKYKIRIHGHTNGSSAGKIISMGESKNFFQLTKDNKEGYGSAKKLSEERALLIQQFLVENGVEAGRTQVKAWGGKQPIYEVDHPAAHANVRVEVEILEN